MKSLLKITVASLALCGIAAQAQVVLQTFSNVADGSLNFFSGTWEAANSTDGSASPNANFVQGAGTYSITGTSGLIPTDNANSKVEFFNETPVSIGSNLFLSVTAQTLATNVASSFTVFLTSGANVAYAVFTTNLFPAGVFTTKTVALTPVGGFNPASIDSLIISGNQPGSTATFNVSFDNISAVASAVAIPEPSTYVAIAGALALGFVAYRRRLKAA